jgi:hypothetical protein
MVQGYREIANFPTDKLSREWTAEGLSTYMIQTGFDLVIVASPINVPSPCFL